MMIDKELLEAMGQLLAPIQNDSRTMKDDIQSLKADVAQTPNMRRGINLIFEGQQGINKKFQKLDKVMEDVEDIKVKVTAMEEVTCSNTSQILKS